MALFPQYSHGSFQGKTFTNLVISEGAAPAEPLIPAATENANVKFQYAFGPDGQTNVVIPKGKIVEAGSPEWDYKTEHFVSTIKIAEPDSEKAIGVNHHNVYQRLRDRFNGNLATVVTRSYIEVPYIDTEGLDTTARTALLNSINYGVAYGDLEPGDFVKVGEYGNFVKADPDTDNFAKIVGQVWAVETDLPPAGFLQYFLDMTENEYAEFVRNASYAPSPGTIHRGRGSQKINAPGSLNPLDKPELLPFKGIPFLTDGYFMAKTEVKDIGIGLDNGAPVDDRVEYVRVSDTGAVNIDAAGTVEVTDYRKAMITVKLKDRLAAMGDGTVTVHIGDESFNSEANPNRVHIDYTNNAVVIYFDENIEAGTEGAGRKAIKIDATQIVNPIAGVPSAWDFEKSMGAVRILLAR